MSRSCAVAARTPGTLLAAMAVPTPVPQMRSPPVDPPLGDCPGDLEGDLRVGDLRCGQVEDVAHAPVLDQSFLKSVLQKGSIARGTDGDSHALSLSGLAAQGEPSVPPNDSRTPAITVKEPDSSRKHDARCSHRECLRRSSKGTRYRGPDERRVSDRTTLTDLHLSTPKRSTFHSYSKITPSAPTTREYKSTAVFRKYRRHEIFDTDRTQPIYPSINTERAQHLQPKLSAVAPPASEPDQAYLSPSIQCCCHWFSEQACQRHRYQLSALSIHLAPAAQGCLHETLSH